MLDLELEAIKNEYADMLKANRDLLQRNNSEVTDFKVRNSYTTKFKENAIRLIKAYGIGTVFHRTNIPLSCLRRWQKQGPERKEGSGRRPFWEDLEDDLLEWFSTQRESSKQVTVPLLQKEALRIFEEKYKDEEIINFKCSIGWVNNWRRRHDVVYRSSTHHQTRKSENEQAIIDGFTGQLEALIAKHKYTPDAIVNIDETPVYWDSTKKRTLEKKVY